MFVFASATSCFGGGLDKRGSVRSYANGVVQTSGGAFELGKLSDLWKQKKIKYRALLFQNSEDASTITVSSWCKNAADDTPAANLSDELYSGLQKIKVLNEGNVTLDGRQGYSKTVQAEMDGKAVFLKTNVVKMNSCVFDFIFVSTPDRTEFVTDFDQMTSGFHYLKGPQIL